MSILVDGKMVRAVVGRIVRLYGRLQEPSYHCYVVSIEEDLIEVVFLGPLGGYFAAGVRDSFGQRNARRVLRGVRVSATYYSVTSSSTMFT